MLKSALEINENICIVYCNQLYLSLVCTVLVPLGAKFREKTEPDVSNVTITRSDIELKF